MTVYIILIIAIILINSGMGSKTNKRKKLAVIFSVGLIFIVQALRKNTVGVDLFHYERFFNIISRYSMWENITQRPVQIEVGYIVFNKLVSYFTKDFQWIIILSSLIFNIGIGVVVYRHSKNPLMSILLYIGMGLFVFSFSGLRQMFAIIFGLFAIEKLMNKKYISWALLIVIAFLFHKSAIVLIATLPLTWLRIRPKHLLVIIPIMLIIIFFARDIAVVLIKLTVPKYLNYVDSGSGYGLFGVFLSILYCVCLVVTYRNNCTNKDSFIRNLALMACMIQLFGNISTVTGRITLYFIIYFALLIPTASNQVSKDRPTEKIINFAMISFIMATLFVQTLLSGYLDISPYKFFWQ